MAAVHLQVVDQEEDLEVDLVEGLVEDQEDLEDPQFSRHKQLDLMQPILLFLVAQH